MTEGKRTVTQRAAMARLRRVLDKEGRKVGYDRKTQSYYLTDAGSYVDGYTYTDFEKWCRQWKVLADHEALEQ